MAGKDGSWIQARTRSGKPIEGKFIFRKKGAPKTGMKKRSTK